MATRLYLSRLAAPISPALQAGWEQNTSSPARSKLLKAKSASDSFATQASPSTAGTSGHDWFMRQFVSDVIDTGTVFATTDSVEGYILVEESGTGMNAAAQIAVYVVSEDGATLRATLKQQHALGAVASEFSTTPTNRRFPHASDDLLLDANYTTVAGDRLVIEVGFRKFSASTTFATYDFGAPSSGTDLAANQTGTTQGVPWLEFSNTIPIADPPQEIAPGIATSTPTAPGPALSNATPQPLAPGVATSTPQAFGPSFAVPPLELAPGVATSAPQAFGPSIANEVTWESDLSSPITFGPATVDPEDSSTIPAELVLTFPTPDDLEGVLFDVRLSLYVTADHPSASADASKNITRLDTIQIESPSGGEEWIEVFGAETGPFVPYGASLGEGPEEENRVRFTDEGLIVISEQEDPPYVGDYLPDGDPHDWLDPPLENRFRAIFAAVDAIGVWRVTLRWLGLGSGNTLTVQAATLTLVGVSSDTPPPTVVAPGIAASTPQVFGPALAGSPPEAAPAMDSDPIPVPVGEDFTTAWSSAEMVGTDRARMIVEVQRGRWNRGYREIEEKDAIDAIIPGEERLTPWMAWWDADEPWQGLTGVLRCEVQQSFGENGQVIATLEVDNTRLKEVAGIGGTYHLFERGYLSPDRGYTTDRGVAGGPATEWEGRLNRMTKIRVWQGYGDPQLVGDEMPEDGGTNGGWAFIGQIDDLDTDSMPDRVVITARTGQTLTDERLFGWNKSKQLDDPITFADRAEADEITLVGHAADASSSLPDALPSAVSDNGRNTWWVSSGHTTPGNTEWVEIKIPPGRYSDFILQPLFPGMEVYIGLNVTGYFEVDGEIGGADGWQTLPTGSGTVPGAHGGWDYLRKIDSASWNQMTRKLGAEFFVANEATLRIGFRNLYRPLDTIGDYAAGVTRLRARRRRTSELALTQDWIFVDDASDVVRTVLRWAGYQDTAIETTGTPLKGHATFNRGTFLIDIINAVTEKTGYNFFMAPPIDGDSWALPVFRYTSARSKPLSIQEVTEDDLLTDVAFKQTDEPLAYIIRVRGKEKASGKLLGGDSAHRIMAVYRPPWSYRLDEDGPDRLAGVLKHVIHTDPALRSVDECQVAARLIALAEALGSLHAVITTPGHYVYTLDDQIGVTDTGSSINSRLWIAERSTEFITSAEETHWTATLSGPLLDTPDIVALLAELEDYGA